MRPTDTAAVAQQADPALPAAVQLVLLALLILGASIWIGGMAAVTVLAVSTTQVLSAADRAGLFRAFGRRYLAVAGAALAVTLVCGGILLGFRPWDGLATAIVAVTAALVVALALGVRQARAMGRLRRAAAERAGVVGTGDGEPSGAAAAVSAGARRALALRSLIGLLSAAVFVLAICTAA